MTFSPRRIGLFFGAATAIWYFLLSGIVGAVPGHPVAERVDAYFQTDAGGRIDDAFTGQSDRSVSAHPILHHVYVVPVYWTTKLLAPWIPPKLTALYGCRAYLALALGLGFGYLIAAMVRFGIDAFKIALLMPIVFIATAQTLASLPDHFGISQALLAVCFGVFLNDRVRPDRWTGWKLAALALVTFGITLTNATFPLGLMLWRWLAQRGTVPKWVLGLAGAAGSSTVAFVLWCANAPHDMPFQWRIKTYLTGRFLSDWRGSLNRLVRGPLDAFAGPTPGIDTNNFHKYRMLTYEPTGAAYPLWPYESWVNVGIIAWIALLGLALVAGFRDWKSRWPVAVLLTWTVSNLLFHILWGDEFFLYSPHYSWAIWAMVVLGLRRIPAKWLIPFPILIGIGQVAALLNIRGVLGQLGG